jgi:D-alanyl-lipoteichoic acid acyltransferase DltB (MBOAT superfamily)
MEMDWFPSGEGRTLPLAAVLGFLAFLVITASLGCYQYLWVFPADTTGLPLWIVIVGADLLLHRGFPAFSQARILLWCAGLLLFTARQGVPFVGVALIFGAAALWVAETGRHRYFPFAATALALLLALGHFAVVPHLLASFFLFRMVSWLVAVRKRGARPDFQSTMEYFLAPAFWLSPMHAAPLLFDRLRAPLDALKRDCGIAWIARGFLHAAVFSLLARYALPNLDALFHAGASAFRWWQWMAAGPVIAFAAYLEISSVSYVAAGALSLGGHHVEPDFNAPWAARGLPDFWARFHYWLHDYYMEIIYKPLVERARPNVALFLTFVIGTFALLWAQFSVHASMALVLALLVGGLTLLHSLAGRVLSAPRVGIPGTWISVLLLCLIAYPACSLDWGVGELLDFFRR